MSETLSFPGLGWNFNINPVIVQITDTWAIKWYGVIVTLGFVLGVGYTVVRAKKFGLDPDKVLDVAIGSVLGGMVGARLYYVFFSDWATYRNDLPSIIRIWEGGIAIYGGIIGGVIAGLLVCRWRKVRALPMLDLAATGLLIGQAVGRWGNFVNMEAFGANTTAPWGMTSPTIVRYLQYRQAHLAQLGVEVDPLTPVHPTFFYESMWCLAGVLFLVWYTRRRRYDGELALIYCGWYGLGRFWIEGLRTDSLMIGSVRVSQALALLCVVASVVVMVYLRGRVRANPEAYRLYVDTPESKALLTGALDPAAAGLARKTAPSANPRGQRKPLRGKKRMAAARRGGVTRKRGLRR